MVLFQALLHLIKLCPALTIFLRNAVNFEDELAIKHEQNANVVSISSDKYRDEQDQKHNRKYNNVTIILKHTCHMIKPPLNH